MKIIAAYPIFNFFGGLGGIVGGHIAHIIGILEGFANAGHEVVVCGYNRVPYLKGIRFKQLDSPRFVTEKGKKLMVLHFGYRDLIKALSQEKPDVLYIRWCGLLHMERIKKYFPNLRIIAECNTPAALSMAYGSPAWLLKHWGEKVDRGFVEAAQLIVAVSEEVKNYLINTYAEYPHDKIVIVPNGVNCSLFKPANSSIRGKYKIPEDVFLLGFSGNFAPWHNLDIIINAVAELPNDTWLMLIGTGPRGIVDALYDQAREQSCEKRIVFTGPVPFTDMPDFVNACDVMLMPQDKGKSFRSPIKLYEYMACGKPIVGADVGQIADTINDGVNGFLFDSESVSDLVARIGLLSSNTELRNLMGQNARKIATEQHSWENRIEIIINALATIT